MNLKLRDVTLPRLPEQERKNSYPDLVGSEFMFFTLCYSYAIT